jgi:hypothetical protein
MHIEMQEEMLDTGGKRVAPAYGKPKQQKY